MFFFVLYSSALSPCYEFMIPQGRLCSHCFPLAFLNAGVIDDWRFDLLGRSLHIFKKHNSRVHGYMTGSMW